MFQFFHVRKTYLALGAAFVLCMFSAVDTTFAQVGFAKLVTLPDTSTVIPLSPSFTGSAEKANSVPPPGADVLPTPSPADPSTLAPMVVDFSAVQSVNAKEMALVSIVLKQVQMAKTPTGAKIVAKTIIASKYKWSTKQVSCLVALWNSESHWNYKARNKRTGAHGIAQALPASKMETIGTDWRTNPVTQLKWGLNYVKVRYGTPCNAYQHKRYHGYY